MATIKQVAKLAGVSVATVSRVINNQKYVQTDTRVKVEEAIRALNYVPNEVARSLFKKESRIVGLILPDITNPFFPELARGVEDELAGQGYNLLIGNSDEQMEKELHYIKTFSQNNIVGVISATDQAGQSNYEGLPFPTVFLDRGSDEGYSVSSDGKEGGRIAAREMVARGSRKIILMKGPLHIQPAQDRFMGAVEILSQSNVDFHVVSMDSFSVEEAKKCAAQIFGSHPEVDGVISSNDITAAAILQEALYTGKAVPDELQIIGFDDIQLSSLTYPALSTIRQPAYEMGEEAAKLLVGLIEKKKIMQNHIQLPVSFIERNTTRKEKDK